MAEAIIQGAAALRHGKVYSGNRMRTSILAVYLLSLPSSWLGAADWPRFLGPEGNGVSRETGLLERWPEEGPPRVWEIRSGETYAAPSIMGGALILFHRAGAEEAVECLNPLDGRERRWRFSYPTDYADDYGYNGGPRATPLIDGGAVFTVGVQGKLHALDLKTGEVIWKRAVDEEHRVPKNFFGTGATPLIEGDLLILNAGGPEAGIVAYDKKTGELRWKVSQDGASYATPIAAAIHGRRHVFVFGKSGLHSIDPATGTERWFIFFRSRAYESVNAATPGIAGDRVFVSASYRTGGLLLKILPGGGYEELWRSPALSTHWSTSLCLDGCLIGFDGRHEPEAILKCVGMENGAVLWQEENLGRGSMILADGRFIILSERGDLILAAASTKAYQEISRLRRVLSNPCWTAPVLAEGRLYVRDERRLICLDLRRPSGDEKAKSPSNGPEIAK